MVQKISINDLKVAVEGRIERIITRISFEERSLILPRVLAHSANISGIAFISGRRSILAETSIAEFQKLHPNVKLIEFDTSDPIKTADSIFNGLRTAFRADALARTIIDVSCFRREELLILLATLKSFDFKKVKAELLYISAKDMAQDWMTKSAIAHRSIIGYGGLIVPSRKTKLILMMGFEVERAQSIIENYEPAEVIVGLGSQPDSINETLYLRNKSFFEDLRRQFEGFQNTFEFSARDPIKTAQDLENAVSFDEASNILIAPLNTKISTIGAGLFALKHKRVQIVYAQMEEYNESAYSVPGDEAFVIQAELLSNTA